MTIRATPSRSARELQDAKVRVGKELRAAGYLYAQKTFIFSAVSGITECGPVIVHSTTDSDESLGRSICDKLLEFGVHQIGNPREYRVADWSAYVASGARSAKQFETSALYFAFSTVSTAIIMRAQPRLSLEQSFYFGAELSSGAEHEVIGKAIRKLVLGVKVLRDGGVL